jgi:hypothetical protein
VVSRKPKNATTNSNKYKYPYKGGGIVKSRL